MKIRIIALLLLIALTLTGCSGGNTTGGSKPSDNPGDNTGNNSGNNSGGNTGNDNIGDDNTGFGEDLEDTGAFDGFFEEETDEGDLVVTFVSGTRGAYTLSNGVLTFSSLKADSVYAVSGKLSGGIVVDIGDSYRLELELSGISIVSDDRSPITVLSGDKVTIQAKKDTENYLYDKRDAVYEDDTTVYSAAIYSKVDLEISGKGKMTIVSDNNNGIHSKDDLDVKNLELLVSCKDNALKGNDSVVLSDAVATLIASRGDAIKTSASDISNKGNQRGTVSINGGKYDLYASRDGIDAAYNVVVSGEGTELNIYTDKYSNYSEEVAAVSGDKYYIRFTSNDYTYSVKYYNSDDDYMWVNAEYDSSRTSGRETYYYYTFPRYDEYSSMQFFMYSSGMAQGQEENYTVMSDYLTPNTGADTFALTSQWGKLYYEWTNYAATPSGGMGGPGGPGGMGEGNTDKGDHSTKGIKAVNVIEINAGVVNIKSYDDAIHANNDDVLENGATPLGNLTINGGSISIYTNDDGLHADGALTINGGNTNILNSYEGAEGKTITQSGGNLYIISKDDGMNSTVTSGKAITLSGGSLYIWAGGDGIDTNTTTGNSGIIFDGAKVIVISTSGGNSAIDTERGYTYTSGAVVAVMPRGGMSGESTNGQGYQSYGKRTEISLSVGQCLVAQIGSLTAKVCMPTSISSAYVVTLGSSSASVSTVSDSSMSQGEYIWQ